MDKRSEARRSLPTEVLRSILLDVDPNDLIALASTNRHLRDTVPGCIDYALARRHVVVASNLHDPDLAPIHYDHPLLFHHTVAEFAIFGIEESVMDLVWGETWKFEIEWTDDERKNAIRLNRVRAMRASIEKREWLDAKTLEDPLDEVDMATLVEAVELLQDLRTHFPRAITDDPDSVAFKTFLFTSAALGYSDGLDLIPSRHRILEELGDDGLSLLDLACAHGLVPPMEVLLSKGASINPVLTGRRVKPPLFFALEANQVQVIKLLLQRGADLATRHNGQTALHQAAREGRCEALKLLLECGANKYIQTRSEEGVTPLGYAAQRGQRECVCVLLDAGADVDAVDRKAMTALAWASGAGHLATVQLLVDRGAEVNPDCLFFSPLYHAIERSKGRIEIVKALVGAGVQVNTVDWKGMTPLHHAMLKKQTGVAMALLDAGADPNLTCASADCMPLHHFPLEAWSNEWEVLLDRLVAKGLNFTAKNASKKAAWRKLCEAGLRNQGWLRMTATTTTDRPVSAGDETRMSAPVPEDAQPIAAETDRNEGDKAAVDTEPYPASNPPTYSTVQAETVVHVPTTTEPFQIATDNDPEAPGISRISSLPSYFESPPSYGDLYQTMFIDNLSSISAFYGYLLKSIFQDPPGEPTIDSPLAACVAMCFMGGICIASLILLLPGVSMLAAIAGACAEALRNYGIAYTNAAARQTVIAAVAATSASTGAVLVAIPVFFAILCIASPVLRPALSILFGVISSVGSAVVTGVVASKVSGQDPIVGATCGAVYGACMLLPTLWLRYCVPRDEKGNRSCGMFFLVDLAMTFAYIPVGIVALKVSVPNYQYNLVGTGSLMGLFGMGSIVSIADTFPNPPQ
ncbi:Ankyrin repeat and SOCS box protein 3 [Phlyctochytrium bullatum]|nr:Ankyrin repeat and SOCS box protein 3 [Phlyctochytrium bullatum]